MRPKINRDMGVKEARRKEPRKCVELDIVLKLRINEDRIKRDIKAHYFYKGREWPEHRG